MTILIMISKVVSVSHCGRIGEAAEWILGWHCWDQGFHCTAASKSKVQCTALHCCLAVYISLRWSAAYLLFCIAIIWWHCWKDFSISEQVALLCSKVVLWNCAHIFITMLCWRISVHHIKVCNSALFKVKSEKCSVSYICSEHTSPLLLCCDQGFNHQRHFCHNTFLS